MQHRFEVGKRPVVHVRRRQLDVAQRRRTEREPVKLLIEELAAAEVERRAAAHSGAELGYAGVGEGLAAQERAAVTAGALGLVAEEEQGTSFLLRSQRRIVVLQIAIEGRVGPGECLSLEGGDRRGGVLEA